MRTLHGPLSVALALGLSGCIDFDELHDAWSRKDEAKRALAFCAPGETALCYSGPQGTRGVGRCAAGVQTCNEAGTGFGPCVGEVLPALKDEDCAAQVDDDCDGLVNEDCAGCDPGATRACYSGDEATRNKGVCRGGLETCTENGQWGACEGEVLPSTEQCDNDTDDDCDGVVNQVSAGCAGCTPDAERSCYSGDPSTLNKGACTAGTQRCTGDGLGWTTCVGEVTPRAENCATPLDEDCDGVINQPDAGCVCTPASERSCYTGPSGTAGQGVCHGGTETCDATGTGYGPCLNEVVPQLEDCTTDIDEDCDGDGRAFDAGCICVPGATIGCYTGPAATRGVGQCEDGVSTCDPAGRAWSACDGEVLPAPEVCGNWLDESCNGDNADADAGCLCVEGDFKLCYSGPVGTEGVGLCHGGYEYCLESGTGWTTCQNEVVPAPESCGNLDDEDCDGAVNEGGNACVCLPGATQACYTGPAGTLNVGVCAAGSQTCLADGTGWASCVGDVVPAPLELCSATQDLNCDNYLAPICSGTGEWFTGFGGWANGVDLPSRVAANADGALYALVGVTSTDTTMRLVKLDPVTGTAQWDVDLGEPSGVFEVATSATGDHAFVLTSSAVRAYESDGGQRWSHTPPAGVSSLAAGPDGGVVVSGNTWPVASSFTIQLYRADGSTAWTTTVPAEPSALVSPQAGVVASPTGEYVTAGYVRGTNGIVFAGNTYAPIGVGNSDLALIMAFTGTGAPSWAKSFPGASATIRQLAVAPDGTIVVAVTCEGSGTLFFDAVQASCLGSNNVHLVKLAPNGDYLWHRSYEAGDWSAMQLDPQGNIVVTGTSYSSGLVFDAFPVETTYSQFVVKLDPNGNAIWLVTPTLGPGSFSNGEGLATGVDDAVYVVGRFRGSVDWNGAAGDGGTANESYVLKFTR